MGAADDPKVTNMLGLDSDAEEEEEESEEDNPQKIAAYKTRLLEWLTAADFSKEV